MLAQEDRSLTDLNNCASSIILTVYLCMQKFLRLYFLALINYHLSRSPIIFEIVAEVAIHKMSLG